MNVLIIGGTRFIGPYVVKQLDAQGHTVTAFSRGISQVTLPKGIKHIRGDSKNLGNFRGEFLKRMPDVVLDMILITEQHAITLVSTFKGITGRIVAISSQDVYRSYGVLLGKEESIEKDPAREDSPLRQKLYPYRGDKLRADDDPQKILDDYDKIPIEKVIMETIDPAGTVVRLPMVYGPNDYQHRLFEYLKRMDDGRPAIVLSDKVAQWRTSRGFVENVADGIVSAVVNDRAKHRIYNVAEPDYFTTAEWIKKIGEAAGWNGEVVVIPHENLPKEFAAGFNTDQHLVVDTKRIRKELGYSEKIPVEEALSLTVEWERAHPPQSVRHGQFDYEIEDKVLQAAGYG